MDTQLIRTRVIRTLNEAGIPHAYYATLPELGCSFAFRSPRAVATRIAQLYGMIGFSLPKVEGNSIINWLHEECLFKSLSAEEQRILQKGQRQLSRDQAIQLSWRRESLYTLCWALGLVLELPFPLDQVQLDCLFPKIPPAIPVQKFIQISAYGPSESEILYQADLHYCLHAAIRNGGARKVQESVVLERRQALEWLITNVPWDEVTLDT